jgi:hypothetical protein
VVQETKKATDFSVASIYTAGALLDFTVQCVPPHELVVLLQFKLSGCVLLVLERGVPAHSGDTTVLLLCALDGDNHPCVRLLSHGYLSRAILCAGCVEKWSAPMRPLGPCQAHRAFRFGMILGFLGVVVVDGEIP